LQEKKLEIYNAIVKLQKGDESDEKLQVFLFALLIYFVGYATHLFPDHLFSSLHRSGLIRYSLILRNL
jgi:hypothetical protein